MSSRRLILRLIVGVILIWAALGKIANLGEFHGVLLAYRLPLPSPFLQLVAIVLPWLELIVGMQIALSSRWTRASLLLAVGLFALFLLAAGQAWLRGLSISCGCIDLRFLGLQRGNFLESAWFACFRAGVLLAVSIWLLRDLEKSTDS